MGECSVCLYKPLLPICQEALALTLHLIFGDKDNLDCAAIIMNMRYQLKLLRGDYSRIFTINYKFFMVGLVKLWKNECFT